ncbi:MAG: hypothetical protein RBT32_00335 [Methanothermobacter sp.]|nr:hypothetical protein [Methanothermobacter tenebrarum]MDD3453871.1 hypothetical protein [Methanobacteriales archaeon]MDI6881774.1 hypothetical protein [Methanothermobacter sp.]MDX9692582.1 hypothetical protein [Methanothermobacter sp.]HOQ19899.1 hypothetical protein [Methanothermobacter sp.]
MESRLFFYKSKIVGYVYNLIQVEVCTPYCPSESGRLRIIT